MADDKVRVFVNVKHETREAFFAALSRRACNIVSEASEEQGPIYAFGASGSPAVSFTVSDTAVVEQEHGPAALLAVMGAALEVGDRLALASSKGDTLPLELNPEVAEMRYPERDPQQLAAMAREFGVPARMSLALMELEGGDDASLF